ncbi:MAG TPA: hypothetical protein VFF30_07610 [Nitrososphaerales archaeon]|nr:hypothetical protein [Nitrososphaerales archaeon]
MAKQRKAMPVSDAEEVTIVLSKLNWELLDLSYRFEWDEPEWSQRKEGESGKSYDARIETLREWNERKKKFLSSIARRAKHESLLGRVVAKGHIGKITFKAIYDMDPEVGLDVNYEVISTKPKGEVRVTEETRLLLKESTRHW